MAITKEQVNGWILDRARTVDELVTIIGVAKGVLDSASYSSQVSEAFRAGSLDADKAEVKRFG